MNECCWVECLDVDYLGEELEMGTGWRRYRIHVALHTWDGIVDYLSFEQLIHDDQIVRW